MFKFKFSDLDLEDNEIQPLHSPVTYERAALETRMHRSETNDGERGKHPLGCSVREQYRTYELSVDDDLSRALPPALSYSPLVIPLSGNIASSDGSPTNNNVSQKGQKARSVTLLRRDLFDARYQLIFDADSLPVDTPSSADGTDVPISVQKSRAQVNDNDLLDFIDNPSDLVPGVYEGGLKTWECSLDLVDYLANLGNERGRFADWVRGKKVIEIGCGTAAPSLYLLHTLFSHPRTAGSDTSTAWTEIVLQDYNDLVLRLVTFPNILLQWYASPLADAYRSQRPSDDEGPFDPTAPGDMHITSDLLSAFRASLKEQYISIRFIAGSWQSLSSNNDNLCTFPFDVTLTSETIYQTSSLPSLIVLLKQSSQGAGVDSNNLDIATRTQDLSLEGRERLCLVAAKVLYFGVGGGVMEFERAVIEAGGKITTALDRKIGVGRKVMAVEWT